MNDDIIILDYTLSEFLTALLRDIGEKLTLNRIVFKQKCVQ